MCLGKVTTASNDGCSMLQCHWCTATHADTAGHVMDVQELVWGGCKLGLLLTKLPLPRVDISLPCGVHTLHCHPSAVAAGLR